MLDGVKCEVGRGTVGFGVFLNAKATRYVIRRGTDLMTLVIAIWSSCLKV